MIKTPSDHLLHSLEGLVPNDFERFKFKLQNTSLEKDQSRIPRGQLQKARPVKLATLLITHYGEECAVRLTLQVLRAINQNFLAEELHKATDPESLIQESGADGSAMSCSSGENKPKGLRIPDVLEGDRQRQSGDGAPSLPSSQPEAGRGTQKKPQGKRRDQKTSEGLDMLGKPGARNVTLSCRKCPFSGKLQGERGIDPSVSLRRNDSLGRLQGLNYGSTKSKINEAHLPSAQKRPRSLEITIFSGEREVPNPETLLSQEKMRSDNPDSAATLSEVATLNVGATVTPEKGVRNPEHSMRKPRDEAVYVLGRAQEGDPVGGTHVRDSCRRSVASRDPKTSDSCSTNCKQQEGLQMTSLSPKALPQCERHMRQAQLLFCEDHREPICLICRLSQEHRGHRVRPIEEFKLHKVPLFQEQIQKQLEYLKELRKSGEEQRSQGDKKTADFLKQIETRKQRIRHQLKQLYHFLEEQEKFFMASLEELGQTIGHVRESYSTRASRDIALLNELIGEMEVKQSQPEWELMQDIGVTLHRAKMVTVPKPWATPPEVEKKMHLFYQKSEFVEKSMKYFSEILHSEMDTINGILILSAVNVILDTETAHPNLIFSNDLKSVRLGNKWDRLPDSPERFDSCIIALGLPSFLSGRHYWEVEVGNKTGWILGICKASMSRKGNMTLSPDNGYWVVMMTKRSEFQVSTIPPTRLQMTEPPRRVGIFLDYTTGDISFYNVTNKSVIYTFTGFSCSGPLQPIFSPGTHDGGKNTDPLIICPVGGQGPP
uniref:Pyrin n=1 Tax=Panthera tigris altaica TaxID=74533 RepID=A0A8C9JYG8_PANTA